MNISFWWTCKFQTLYRGQVFFTNKLWFVIGHHLIEDVVASLIRKLECHSRLLQQIWKCHSQVTVSPVCHITFYKQKLLYSQVSISALASLPVVPKWILMNLPCSEQSKASLFSFQLFKTVLFLVMKPLYTYETRGVVISHGFGITVGLQQRVGSNNLVLQGALDLE